MKKYILIVLAAITLSGLSGCQTEKIVGLDGSVDEKINTLIDGYVTDLKEAPYGWLAAIGTSKGYYRFWLEFKDEDVVNMYTDNIMYNNYETAVQSSTYAFRALQRPTLIFDTYSYLSIINDPTHSISGGSGNNGKGLVTDFEFEVVNYDKDKETFHMQGRFNKVNAVLVKATEEDFNGVENGLLMSRLRATYSEHINNYIIASVGAAEIVTKLSDLRYTYQFWYDTNTELGFSETGFYNTSVDGSGDLSFPEPVNIGDTSLTGLRFEKSNPDAADDYSGEFTGFYTADGGIIPAKESSTPPSFPLEMIFGHVGEDVMFDAATTTGTLVENLTAGQTKNALDLFQKFLNAGGSFSLVLSYAQNYYFTYNESSDEVYFNIYMAPSGLGIEFEDGVPNITTTFAIALYQFPVTFESENRLEFKLSNVPIMNEGARKYYTNGVMTEAIDLFKGNSFEMKWSETPLNEGLVIEFKATTSGVDFNPPAVMYKR